MYNQRLKVFMVLTAVALAVLVARLGQLQLLRGREYRQQIERTLEDSEFLPASRGQILDRHDRILAMDEPCFDFCMDFGLLNADEKWTQRQRRAIQRRLAVEQDETLHLSDQELAQIASAELERRIQAAWALAAQQAAQQGADLDTTCARVRSRVMAIHERVGGPVREETWAHPIVTGLDDAAAVEAKSRLGQTIGVSVQPSRRRLYPYGDVACHIIGVTGPVAAEDVERLTAGAAYPDWGRLEDAWRADRVGKSGIEKLAEDRLRAAPGYRRTNTGNGQVLEAVEARDGQDVRLSLDVALQAEVMKLFPRGQTGCAVLLDVAANQVLAMVSLPTFDLNRYRRDFPILAHDEVYTPLRHRAVSQLYPPGSTAKVVAALGALTDGVAYPGTRYVCRGYLYNPDEFRCWVYKAGGAHGELDMVEAIAHSCNVYFYHLGEELGGQRMSQWLRRFGFVDLPGTGLPEERAGQVQTPSTAGAARMQAIGQGPVAVTALHVANAMAAIARDGAIRPATLLVDEAPAPGSRPGLGLSQEHLDLVRQGMHKVCNQPGATAYSRFHGPDIGPLDFDVCGKTGTAAVPPQRIDSDGDGALTEADQVVRQGDMAWFAGFAPYNQPQVAVAVVVEYVEEGGGAKDAAPIAREALRLCRQMGYIR